MRRNLSITTAAAALLIGTVFAAAQGVQGQGQGGAQGQGGTQMAPQQDGGKGKAQTKEPRTQGQGGQAQGQPGQAAPEPKSKAQSKEPSRTQGQGQREGQPQQQGQPQQSQQPKQQQPQQPQQGQQTPRGGDTQKGAETKGGAQTGGVTLTQEQRTTIRTTVLQGSNAPRVNNVNFSLNVGTVVPRTGVTLVAVPATLVEIHPAWRGFMYFIVGERIIIVDPSSHKIVAVLVV